MSAHRTAATSETIPSSDPAMDKTVPSDPELATSVRPDDPNRLVGLVLSGAYRLIRPLGEGGMGAVYLAEHLHHREYVAVKVLHESLADDEEMAMRFEREARAASQIGNPHIVDVIDFGRSSEGWIYLVMEYLPGESLGARIDQRGALTEIDAVNVAAQIAEGLDAAHRAGIVHRDLKPDNVMIVPFQDGTEFVKVLDFGIAKVAGRATKLTRTGDVFGTPFYMSPEQAAGASIDLRTDVYALGVILYEMLVGVVPFDGETFMAVLSQHMYKAPAPLAARGVESRLEPVIFKCLAKAPSARYASMSALVDDMKRAVRGERTRAAEELAESAGAFVTPDSYFSGDSARHTAPARHRRSRVPLVLTFALAIAGAGGAFAYIKSEASTPTVSAGGTEPDESATERPGAADDDPVSAQADPARPVASTGQDRQLVVLAVTPSDAEISRDGKSLGKQPVPLFLLADEVAEIEVARPGYVTRRVSIDTSEPKRVLELRKAGRAKAPVRKTPRPRPKTPPKSGSISDLPPDPWLKNKR